MPQKTQQNHFHLWRADPAHPSLGFRRLQGKDNFVTVRIGDHYRTLGELESDTVTWVWIGTHAEYDRLTR
jgi:hypothetical protein